MDIGDLKSSSTAANRYFDGDIAKFKTTMNYCKKDYCRSLCKSVEKPRNDIEFLTIPSASSWAIIYRKLISL